MKTIEKVVTLAEKVQYMLIATADEKGHPHIGSAGKFSRISDNKILLSEWFCPGTMHNLQQNPQIAIVLWDRTADAGYQLLGRVETIRELSMLDGYAFGDEQEPSVPQVERELLICIDEILEFAHTPHTDVPLT